MLVPIVSFQFTRRFVIWLSENIKRLRNLEVCICSTMLIRMLVAKTLHLLMLDTKKALV